ncbi:hypothetical protein GEMRC1_006301 [Eukaryota sp. GEM-RC1]
MTKLNSFSIPSSCDIRSLTIVPPPLEYESKFENCAGLVLLCTSDSMQLWSYSAVNEAECVHFKPLPRYLSPSQCVYRKNSHDLLLGSFTGVIVEVPLGSFFD